MKYRIDPWLNLDNGEIMHHVQMRMFFFWIDIAKTTSQELADELLARMEELNNE
jgi:hypothetical protein